MCYNAVCCPHGHLRQAGHGVPRASKARRHSGSPVSWLFPNFPTLSFLGAFLVICSETAAQHFHPLNILLLKTALTPSLALVKISDVAVLFTGPRCADNFFPPVFFVWVSFAMEGEAGGTEAGCALAGGLSKGLCYVNRKLRESPSVQVGDQAVRAFRGIFSAKKAPRRMIVATSPRPGCWSCGAAGTVFACCWFVQAAVAAIYFQPPSEQKRSGAHDAPRSATLYPSAGALEYHLPPWFLYIGRS